MIRVSISLSPFLWPLATAVLISASKSRAWFWVVCINDLYCALLISLSMTFFKFILIVTNDTISFLFYFFLIKESI